MRPLTYPLRSASRSSASSSKSPWRDCPLLWPRQWRRVDVSTTLPQPKGLARRLLSDSLRLATRRLFRNYSERSRQTVLSSSQMNVLAVCTFLSLNLGVSSPPLECAILDDPLQSLDDINLLGLIDLLRRTKDQRQLFVSTHDVRFGDLLARKLRPGSSEQRTVVIELDGWSRKGPIVTTRDVHCDPVPLRLIAATSGNR